MVREFDYHVMLLNHDGEGYGPEWDARCARTSATDAAAFLEALSLFVCCVWILLV
jgi:hypothetical protein